MALVAYSVRMYGCTMGVLVALVAYSVRNPPEEGWVNDAEDNGRLRMQAGPDKTWLLRSSYLKRFGVVYDDKYACVCWQAREICPSESVEAMVAAVARRRAISLASKAAFEAECCQRRSALPCWYLPAKL